MFTPDIINYVLPHRVNIRQFIDVHRADAYDTEHMAESVNRLLLVPVAAAFHIDPAALFPYRIIPFYVLQLQAHLLRQCVLKYMTVFPFKTDFSVFNQKCMIHIFLSGFILHIPPATGVANTLR